ncbi:MAG: NADH-quinone oxidoreductase subunit J, partial [Phycisphaerae bacterium]|nr:NADH-quinone oxidoreductase subunit J [Phycisphaerae bacterium]
RGGDMTVLLAAGFSDRCAELIRQCSDRCAEFVRQLTWQIGGSGWTTYLIALAGAVAIYCILPRVPRRVWLFRMGKLLGAAALAGVILWLAGLQWHRSVLPPPALPDDLPHWQQVWLPVIMRLFPTRQDFYFDLFALIALFGAVRSMTHAKPLYCALYFVLTILAVGAVLLLLAAEFLAIALILIYAGAILVLYVFVIMLASGRDEIASDAAAPAFRSPAAALILPFLLLAALGRLIADPANWPSPIASLALNGGEPDRLGSTAAVGRELFTHHLVALELAGVVLLVGIVGAIALVVRKVEAKE